MPIGLDELLDRLEEQAWVALEEMAIAACFLIAIIVVFLERAFEGKKE